nr:hypothetical protein [Tanacetum cinerariifolium]
MTSAVICLATRRKFNFSKYIRVFDSMVKNVDSLSKFLMYPRFIQVLLDHQVDDMTTYNTRYKSSAITQKIETCATLLQKVNELEKDRNSQGLEILRIKKRVKRLERKKKSKTSGLKRLRKVGADQKVESSSDTILEVQKVTARDEQERADMEKALELQRQLDEREDDIDWSAVAEQNIAGYKMEFFKGMTYDEIRPIFEREEDLVALWNLVKERFSSAKPIKDKERALWVELKRLFKPNANDVPWKLQRYMHALLTWRLYSDCGVHHVSSTRGHDIYMLIEKDYPMSNDVMILMLSGKL